MYPFIELTLLPVIAALYFLGLIAYRLFLHPLSGLPGSKFAAATKWYEFYYDLLKRPGGTFMHEIERMHEVYGPIVRINPDEVHIKDSDWVGTLYTGSAGGLRDKYGPAAHMTGTPLGTFGTIEHDVHRRRRAAVSPFFSKSTVFESESMIQTQVNKLGRTLERRFAAHEPVEMRTAFLALTTDTLSDHAFHTSMNLLDSDQRAADWKKTIKAVAILTPLIKQFTWIIPLALRLPLLPLQIVVPHLARIVALHRDMHTQSRAAIRDSKRSRAYSEPLHIESGKARSLDLFQSILLNKGLSAKEKDESRLAQEGFVTLVAGGETTARVLTTALFFILANKEWVLLRLKEELNTVMDRKDQRADLKTLERLPWLNAIVRESLRITALVTSRLPLVSPKEALVYGKYIIPPGTPVSMTLRDVLLDPDIFDEPYKFQPERWLQQGHELEKLNRGYVPFGRGNRMCLGLNFALAEIYITIACLFHRFDLTLHDTTQERDIDVVRDCFIGEPSPQSKGVFIKPAAWS